MKRGPQAAPLNTRAAARVLSGPETVVQLCPLQGVKVDNEGSSARAGPGALVLDCVLERPRHAELLQPAQRADLHLADPLSRDAEVLADLLERHRVVPVQPVAQLDDLPF